MVEINGIGVNPNAVMITSKNDPRCGRSPTLAERARKLVEETNGKMFETCREEITRNILSFPTKQSYTFDMKRFIGTTMGQECTKRAFDMVGEWLSEEGLTYETQASRTSVAIQHAMSRRISGSTTVPERTGYSEYTYFITW